MDWVWIVGLTWLALALPIALLGGHVLRRADLRDARGRESLVADRRPARPLPLVSVRHRRHTSSERHRALHCPGCRSAGTPPDRGPSGPPGVTGTG